MSAPITDATGRFADLARHIVAEIEAVYNDLHPLHRRSAILLKQEAAFVANALSGYTEMPDAKRERIAP